MASPFTVTENIDQRFIIEPLGGPREPQLYIDHLPEEVYNTNFDSHLVRFLYAMLGPSGIGHIRKQYLQARLIYEAHDIELFDLDKFYGDPLRFGRITDEEYTADVAGLLTQDQWEVIRAKDAKYRNRIIDFLTGVRAGNTPQGMHLVARSGLGHEVEVIENYKSLFDGNSDDPLGIPLQGTSLSLNEMIIIPRQEVTKSEVQVVTFSGTVTGGTWRFTTQNPALTSSAIAWNASRQEVQIALTAMFGVSLSSFAVTGGPLPDEQIEIRFTGDFEGRNVEQLGTLSSLSGTTPAISVSTKTQGFDASQEIVDIPPVSQHHLQDAIDRIKPMTTIPTTGKGAGTRSRIDWIRAGATSEFDEMVRYVTGTGSVLWPPLDDFHWIESGKEHQAPRPYGDLPYQYSLFHRASRIDSYDETALARAEYLTNSWPTIRSQVSSLHIGTFEPHHTLVYPFLGAATSSMTFDPPKALSPLTDQLVVNQTIETPDGPIGMLDGIYPSDYLTLPGVPVRPSQSPLYFWASVERTSGTEYLEIDLGSVRAVNAVMFETTRKPLSIEISYDLLDDVGVKRAWTKAFPVSNLSSSTIVTNEYASVNPWTTLTYDIRNLKGEMIFTRYIRLKFERIGGPNFLTFNNIQYPWSVDVRNLRIGRVVANQ